MQKCTKHLTPATIKTTRAPLKSEKSTRRPKASICPSLRPHPIRTAQSVPLFYAMDVGAPKMQSYRNAKISVNYLFHDPAEQPAVQFLRQSVATLRRVSPVKVSRVLR